MLLYRAFLENILRGKKITPNFCKAYDSSISDNEEMIYVCDTLSHQIEKTMGGAFNYL